MRNVLLLMLVVMGSMMLACQSAPTTPTGLGAADKGTGNGHTLGDTGIKVSGTVETGGTVTAR